MKKLLVILFLSPLLLQGSLQTELQELQRKLSALERTLNLGVSSKQLKSNNVEEKIRANLVKFKMEIKALVNEEYEVENEIYALRNAAKIDQNMVENIVIKNDLVGEKFIKLNKQLENECNLIEENIALLSMSVQRELFAFVQEIYFTFQDFKDRLNKIVSETNIRKKPGYDQKYSIACFVCKTIHNASLADFITMKLGLSMSKCLERFRQNLGRKLGVLEEESVDEKYILEQWNFADEMFKQFNDQSKVFLQELEKFKLGMPTQEDFEDLEKADPTIALDQFKLQSFVNNKRLANYFPDLYKDIRAFLYHINSNIKKLIEKLTNFYRNNYKQITVLKYETYKGKELHLPTFIDEIKERLDAWRNAILYGSIVKPIEDELGVKKGDW